MSRKTSIVAGTLSACVVAIALGVGIPKLSAQPADAPPPNRDGGRPPMSQGGQEMATRAKDMLNDVDKVKGIRKDLVGSGADVDEMRHAIAREQAEREMMRDPDLREKINQLAKDPEISANLKSQTLTPADMRKDDKLMRRMIGEMVIRESVRQQRMGDNPPRREGEERHDEKKDGDNR